VDNYKLMKNQKKFVNYNFLLPRINEFKYIHIQTKSTFSHLNNVYKETSNNDFEAYKRNESKNII